MDRYSRLTNERDGRSAEDSFAAHRIKLYKELRKLSEMDAPKPRPAHGETPSATVGDGARMPAEPAVAFLEKTGPSGPLSRPKAPVLGHSSGRT
jgi:hypothetical protein